VKTSATLFLLSTFLLAAPAASQQTWVIKPDGTGDAPTIQAGIDSASWCDVVLVECGTYYEHDIQMKSGVILQGASLTQPCVTIDAEWNGRVIACLNLVQPTRIEGLILTHGNGEGFPSCGPGCGGAMYVRNSSLSIVNCTFVDNRAWGMQYDEGDGGGLYCKNSSPTLTGCTFSHNSAGSGGGMKCYESSATLSHCTFTDNATIGLLAVESSLSLTRSLFIRNHASWWGAGLAVTRPTGPVEISRCTFAANYAYEGGAGIFLLPGSDRIDVVSTIVAFSTRGSAIAVPFGDPDPVTFVSCNVYGNAGGDWVGEVADQADKNCNFSLDPLFCDADNDDYTLRDTSPCAPGNHPQGCDFGQIGARSVGCTDTAVEPTTWGRIKAMFR